MSCPAHCNHARDDKETFGRGALTKQGSGGGIGRHNSRRTVSGQQKHSSGRFPWLVCLLLFKMSVLQIQALLFLIAIIILSDMCCGFPSLLCMCGGGGDGTRCLLSFEQRETFWDEVNLDSMEISFDCKLKWCSVCFWQPWYPKKGNSISIQYGIFGHMQMIYTVFPLNTKNDDKYPWQTWRTFMIKLLESCVKQLHIIYSFRTDWNHLF